ncbi:MAG: DUF3108 domain-containing protein [Sterolibacterium sp.]|nr:DUF3108 domain-containing protein [Sterolibacterium sp.]
MMTKHCYSARFTWALLASLLIHLALIGDLTHLDWWQPTMPDSSAFPLEVQLSPSPGESPPLPSIVQVPAEQALSPQEISEAMNPAPAPIREQVISIVPADETQKNAADLRETPPTALPPTQNSDRIAQRLPPSGKLVYRFYWGEARWLAGQAVHQWVIENGIYTLSSTVSTTGLIGLLRPIKLVEISQGMIIDDRLRPLKFSTQWNENPPAVSIFSWDKGNLLWSRGNASSIQPLSANSYDKISYLYQLYLAAAKENFFSPEITLGRHLEHYEIQDLGLEELEIDGRILPCIHLKRVTTSTDLENVEIWLSTTFNNLPIKMTYSNKSGDHFEQLISLDSVPSK